MHISIKYIVQKMKPLPVNVCVSTSPGSDYSSFFIVLRRHLAILFSISPEAHLSAMQAWNYVRNDLAILSQMF